MTAIVQVGLLSHSLQLNIISVLLQNSVYDSVLPLPPVFVYPGSSCSSVHLASNNMEREVTHAFPCKPVG